MELIDDWGEKERTAPVHGGKGPAPASPRAIGAALAAFESQLLNVHCYQDVGYPWVQVVFRTMITPELALRVGKALADVAGTGNVYFNSLRPEAVYFVLEPAFTPKPDLPASRYGTPLAALRAAWLPGESRPKSPAAAARLRSAASR